MAVLSVAGVFTTCGAPKRLGSSPDVIHAPRELLTSACIVAEIQNMCNQKMKRALKSAYYAQRNAINVKPAIQFHQRCWLSKLKHQLTLEKRHNTIAP